MGIAEVRAVGLRGADMLSFDSRVDLDWIGGSLQIELEKEIEAYSPRSCIFLQE